MLTMKHIFVFVVQNLVVLLIVFLQTRFWCFLYQKRTKFLVKQSPDSSQQISVRHKASIQSFLEIK